MMEDYELCKQLYELTGWEHIRPSATTNRWYSQNGSIVMNRSEKGNAIVPVYSTDYLLTKLPAYHEYWNGGNESGYFHLDKYNRDWVAGYTGLDENNAMQAFTFSASTPKTALLKLAIELAKAGVIGKEGE